MHPRRENICHTLNPHLNGAEDGKTTVKVKEHGTKAVTPRWKIPEVKNTATSKTTIYTNTSEKQKKEKIYTHEQYEDLVFNGDEDVGGSGTPREGEPALGAMRFVQLEVG